MSFFKVQNREKNGDKSNTRRFPSCLKPLFQSEAKCEDIDTNMILYSRVNEAHFQKECFALNLVVYKPRELITKSLHYFLTIQHFLPFLTIQLYHLSTVQTSHKATPTKNWTPLAATPSNPTSQTPSSPVSEDALASFCPHPNTSYERCHSSPLEVAESVSPSESSPESVSGFDSLLSCLSACNSYDNQSTEGNGLLIDGVAMQRW